MSLFWVCTHVVRLAIMERPRGWDWLPDEIRSLKHEGVDVVVSALTVEASEELGLSEEAACCRASEIDFIWFPIEDRSVPESIHDFSKLLDRVQTDLSRGRAVAVHCRMGIGRSSLVAAALLRRYGFSTAEAFQSLEKARGLSVPDTPEQRAWVNRLVMRPGTGEI